MRPLAFSLAASPPGKTWLRQGLTIAGLVGCISLTVAQPAAPASHGQAEKLDATQTAAKLAGIEGSFGGIGAKLTKTNGVLQIEGLLPASPAERAGLQAGSEIAAINGIPTAGMELNDAVKLLRGPIGTEVKLDLIPPGGPRKQISLAREKVLTSPVESRLLEGGVLFIRPSGFDKETPTTIRGILGKHGEAKGIILDLRASPGGLADAIAQVAGLFQPRDATLWYFRDPSGRVSERKNQGDPCTTLPLAVFANHQTSYGGELLVSALQRNHRATALGQPTPGLISVTPMRELVKSADGSSRLEPRGLFQLSRDGSVTNVVPHTLLPGNASDAQFILAARAALAIPGKPSPELPPGR